MKYLPFAALLAAASVAGAAQAGVTVTYEAPGVETSQVSFTGPHGSENFNALTAGDPLAGFSTDFGTGGVITGVYSSGVVRGPDIYGGAGQTNYVGAAYQDPVTLTLTNTNDPNGVDYFGFYLQALDAGNTVSLYENNTLLESFSASTILNAVQGDPAYFGNPSNNGSDGGEPFVFVNFFSTTDFNRVVFTESIPGNGYESDNHTVGEDFTGITGTNTVPEPATWGLMLLGFGAIGLALRGRRSVGVLA